MATPRTALAIAAHPDDVEFQCGATLAKWASEGCEVHHLICTDGSKGTWDPDRDQDALIATRIAEQRAAARALGATGEVIMLDRVDGELDADADTTDEIAGHIRRLRPDVVLGHDPWRRWRLHPDHRAAGWLTCNAVVAARDPHFMTHHDHPHHRPDALLLFECEEPDHYECVDGAIGNKVDALLEHRSQFETTMDIDDPSDEEQVRRFEDRIRAEARSHGRRVGLRYAEPFRRLPV